MRLCQTIAGCDLHSTHGKDASVSYDISQDIILTLRCTHCPHVMQRPLFALIPLDRIDCAGCDRPIDLLSGFYGTLVKRLTLLCAEIG